MAIPSWAKALSFLTHRYLLGTRHLTAEVPGRDFDMRVKVRDVIGRHIYKYGAHDPSLTAFIEDTVVVRPGDVLLDVGANVGWFSLVLHAMAPGDVDIFAFEPHPENRALLEGNLVRNGASSVAVVAAAVSEGPGEEDLYLFDGENSGRHSLLPIRGAARVPTATVALDDFWAGAGLGRRTPRLLKIDIEGFELAALRGARHLLSRCPTVVLEYSPALMRGAGHEPAQLLDLLADEGFSCGRIVDGGRIPAERDRLLASDRQVNLVWDRPAAPSP